VKAKLLNHATSKMITAHK